MPRMQHLKGMFFQKPFYNDQVDSGSARGAPSDNSGRASGTLGVVDTPAIGAPGPIAGD